LTDIDVASLIEPEGQLVQPAPNAGESQIVHEHDFCARPIKMSLSRTRYEADVAIRDAVRRSRRVELELRTGLPIRDCLDKGKSPTAAGTQLETDV
jgi:hypothetical protein